MTTPTDQPTLHEFEPFPITKDDKPGHVCNAGCWCARCGQAKGNREYHVQHRRKRASDG